MQIEESVNRAEDIARQVAAALVDGTIEKSPSGLAKLQQLASRMLEPVDEGKAGEVLDALPDDDKRLVLLHRQQGFTMDQIAAHEGKSKDEIIKRLSQIYSKIRVTAAP